MRLWSLHPKYLDTKGLVALWREALLAQKVLQGTTQGYTNHPQLQRFKATSNPQGALSTYLRAVADKADARGYQFDRDKIGNKRFTKTIDVTSGQIDYEKTHLLRKLDVRDPDRSRELNKTRQLILHPLFRKVKGEIESWEVVQ